MGARDRNAGEGARTTIAAIASPGGEGARGVIRVSGPRAADIVRATWSGGPLPDLGRRSLHIGRFEDGRGTQPLLLLWMGAPHSFTREDVAELHLPGSPPLLAAALRRILALGAVAAEPGEFTRRAFHSGRIDLTRAEGVLALVESANEAQARSARALLFGGLEERVARAREELVGLRTLSEASLDFDAQDTGHVPTAELRSLHGRAEAALEEALGFEVRRDAGAGDARVVLTGAPNAGKSALFNALLGSAAALVSDHAGTTRDALEARVEAGGAAIRLFDTAGLDPRVPAAGPDGEAQARARGALEEADLLVWVVDASRARRDELERERAALGPDRVCLAWNKVDLAPGPPPAWIRDLRASACAPVSAATGAGLEDLRAAIAGVLEAGAAGEGGGGLERETALRHRAALELAREELRRARAALDAGLALELVAEHLRRSTDELDRVSGATTSEDVLDRIFARFCLGK